jgi:hypothetical protein
MWSIMRLNQILEGISAQPGRKMLSFDEVMASDRPAVFREFGDSLLYVDGRVYILNGIDLLGDPEIAPPVLDPEYSVRAVGIEVGWRHVEGCDCEYCTESVRATAA